MYKHFIILSALANPETMEWGLSEKARTKAVLLRERKILTIKASVEVSVREWTVGMMRPAIWEVGSFLVRRSTMRMRGVMKKTLEEV